ncbi:MAG TPA: peptidoglycan-binding protein [Propionibacteriaceae bacterium]|nr:peptidoglycan-binding protein [Propionibacteriaceae bacterium]
MSSSTRPVRLAVGLLTAGLLALSGCAQTAVSSTAPAPSATSVAPTTAAPVPSPSSAAPASTAPETPAAPTSAAPTTTAPAAPAVLMKAGSTGDQVRELQSRLTQLDWYEGKTTGNYDDQTVDGVRGFQGKRSLPTSGEVDQTTWTTLLGMTRQPTKDEMNNVLTAGPALLKKGDTGEKVKDLQARLKQLAWFSGDVTGTYGDTTLAGVKGFQGKREIPVTGEVDQRTLDRLVAMTRKPTSDELNNVKPSAAPVAPGAVDDRCLTGRVLCIDKTTRKLRWMNDGAVISTFDVRFGSQYTPTREGTFSVFWKSRDHVSTLYNTPMPYAMFFSGGQAVHYSADFAANGYNGASHGCVNVRDKAGIARLFDQVNNGDKVVVYRS